MFRNSIFARVMLVGFVVLGSTALAVADDWLNPTNVRVSSYDGADQLPKYAVNGAGLSGTLLNHDMHASQTMWVTEFAPDNWAGWFEVDLGSVCDISSMDLYNFNDKWSDIDATDRGVSTFQILVSNDGVNYTPLGNTQNALKAPGKDTEEPIVYDTGCPPQKFNMNTSARFVRLEIYDNHGYRHTVNGVVGLSELRFYGSSTTLGGNVSCDNFAINASSTMRGDVNSLVDGTGLIEGSYGAHEWHNGGANGETGWAGYKNADGEVELMFEFDDPTDLASIEIWNLGMWFSMAAGSATKDFRLEVRKDGEIDFLEVVDGQLSDNSYVDNYDYSELFDINTTDVVEARLVIESTYYEPSTTAALSEILFIEMVPEPATILILGLGAVLLLRRRRVVI